MSDARSLVREAIEATRFHGATRYSWFGRMSPRLPPRVVAALTPRAARDYLTHTLAGQLYRDFYVRGRAEPAQWQPAAPMTTSRAFEAALSAANCGHGYVDEGWRVQGVSGPWAVVSKAGLELTVSRSELIDANGTEFPGDAIALHMPNELPRISPGFYTACGNTALEEDSSAVLLRIYWHLDPAGAVPFVRAATECLNAERIAFRLKVLNDPGAFSRCDAAVIYLHDSAVWEPLVISIRDRIAQHLRDRIPVFTHRLAAGVGMAESPGANESFGQHRCRLVAEGLVSAFELGVAPHDIMAVVEQRFSRDGVDLDVPHRSRPRVVDEQVPA